MVPADEPTWTARCALVCPARSDHEVFMLFHVRPAFLSACHVVPAELTCASKPRVSESWPPSLSNVCKPHAPSPTCTITGEYCTLPTFKKSACCGYPLPPFTGKKS